MMKRILTFLLLIAATFSLKAQIQEGGVPPSFMKANDFTQIDTKIMTTVDVDALRTQDAIFDEHKDIPWRFGQNLDVDISITNAGSWEVLPNGDDLWRVKIHSSGAQTINLGFDNFYLPEGTKMFIYNEAKTNVLGAFTANNNKEHGNFATNFIEGETIIVEVVLSQYVQEEVSLHINRVTHGYRSLDYKVNLKGIGDSGSCNNNVICPEGDDWRDEIRSVGILITGGSGFCSGTLINNTCEDGIPYFLTANHCVENNSSADFDNIIVRFNFDSDDCATNSISGPSQTVSGTDLVASNAGSDFALLLLESTPPSDYNVYYAGWDRSGNSPTSQVGIHHPAGDLKKISFDNQAAVQATYSGALCWNILNWEDGTTEGGSSGSALFDQNHRLIGQLYGGSASCSSVTDDYYGRFDVSWDNGSGTTNELQSWLDGCNTGTTTVDGYDPNAIVLDNDIQLSFVGTPSAATCGQVIPQQIRVRNSGNNAVTSVTFTHGITGNLNAYNWTGNLAAGEFEIITLDDLVVCDGTYDYSAEILSSNLTMDENPSNDAFDFSFSVTGGEQFVIEIQENAVGSENTFTVTDENGTTIASGGPFVDFFTDFALDNHQYDLCLPSGNYTFTINDAGGDGLLATFGAADQGYYRITQNGTEIATEDDFGSQDVVNFSSAGTGINADFDVTVNGLSVTVSDISTGGTIVSQDWEATGAATESGTGSSFTTTYANSGTYSITLYVKTANGCEAITKSVTITNGGGNGGGGGVGINDVNIYNLSIYPNPSNGMINITFDSSEKLSLSIINTVGAVVSDYGSISNNERIDINHLAGGIYFVKLQGEKGTSIQRLIVK